MAEATLYLLNPLWGTLTDAKINDRARKILRKEGEQDYRVVHVVKMVGDSVWTEVNEFPLGEQSRIISGSYASRYNPRQREELALDFIRDEPRRILLKRDADFTPVADFLTLVQEQFPEGNIRYVPNNKRTREYIAHFNGNLFR